MPRTRTGSETAASVSPSPRSRAGGVADRHRERGLVSRAALERRPVAGREQREADADEQEGRGRDRPRGCAGEREEGEAERARTLARGPLGGAHERADQTPGGD